MDSVLALVLIAANAASGVLIGQAYGATRSLARPGRIGALGFVLITAVIDIVWIDQTIRYPPEFTAREAGVAADKQQLTGLLQAMRLAALAGVSPEVLATAWTGQIWGWEGRMMICKLHQSSGMMHATWRNDAPHPLRSVSVEGIIKVID